MSILNEIAEYAAYRVFLDKREYSLEELKEKCDELISREDNANSPDEAGLYCFGQALKKPGISIISEIK